MTTIKLKNGSGAPAGGDLVQGEPALDLTNKRLYTENGSGTVIEVGTNPTSITTGDITATGTASFANLATTGNITFGDNDKAVFGAGSDLQIYHDASDSYIKDEGTGNLYLTTNGSTMNLQAGSDNMVKIYKDAQVEVFHDASVKLATTSTGIDVTGTVTADGLTVANTAVIAGDFDGGTAATYIRLQDDTDNFLFGSNNSLGNFLIKNETADALRLSVANTGDISFYEDTGTTAKFFWDASAESLGIGQGVFSGTQALNLKGEGIAIKNDKSGSNNNWSLIRNTGTASTSNISFVTGSGEALVLAHDTNVGIGTDSPNSYSNLKTLTINGTNGSVVDFETNGTLSGEIFSESNSLKIDAVGSSGVLKLLTNSAERMRITSAGDVEVKGGQELKVYRGDNATYGSMKYLTGSGGLQFNDQNSDGISFVRGGSTESMRIDSAGRVGIGTSSPTVGKLQVNDGSGAIVAITRTSGATSGNLGVIRFGNTDIDSNLVNITAIQDGATNSSALTFETQPAGGGTTERMRIDSSGNLLVGGTNTAPGVSNTEQGVSIRGSGDHRSFFSVSGNYVAAFNRNTNDGPIVEFNKDGVGVGSIFNSGTTMGIGSLDTGVLLANNIDAILPWNSSTNAERDNAIDLGRSSGRFKDLYLSGGVYLGGTGSANKLDDYEEGTFTPTITSGTVTYTTQRGRYTKIGRVVHIHAFVQIASISGSSGTAIISGLPFTAKNDSNYSALASKTNGFNWGGSATMITFQVIPNTAVIGAVGSGNNIAFNDVNSSGLTANDWIACTGHYVTDS
jgi:hypothetical protein